MSHHPAEVAVSGKKPRLSVLDFQARKLAREKISMVTCYDAWTARILNETDIDCLLVGDSLAVVMHGFDSTVHATIEMMELHTAAVKRGAPDKFIVADMPFLTCSRSVSEAMDAVQQLMQAGAHSVKITLPGDDSGPAEISAEYTVTLPLRETLQTHLDRPRLINLANSTNGQYFDADQAQRFFEERQCPRIRRRRNGFRHH